MCMTVLAIQKIKHAIGIRDLLNVEKLQVQDRQRIGLIGPNGSGKTTLFNILNGDVEADVADFHINGSVTLLPQLKKTDTNKSGGEVTQAYILEALARNPKLLLADEPTTNLDTSHTEWVEKQFRSFQGAILLISHDRTFLDELCDMIWELDEGQITEYSGNYSAYVQQKENERKHQQKEYEKFQQKRQQLEDAIGLKERQAQRAGKSQKKLTSSEARDASGVSPHHQTIQKGLHQNRKALEKRLEKLEVVERPEDEMPIQMKLPNEKSFKNKVMIRAEQIKGEVGDRELWEPTTFFIKGGAKVGLIGPNGSGKTTLIRQIIANETEQLYCSPAMKIGYFAQNLNLLETERTILENVKQDAIQNETLIRTVLAQLGFYRDDVYKKIAVLSGGERVKVSLAKLLVGDYNTLILDEPTNYLDVYALEALETLLQNYEGTLLFVSHDRHFVSEIADNILAFEDGQLEWFKGDYKTFLNRDDSSERDMHAEELAAIEMKITRVLSDLSHPLLATPDKEALDQEFQALLKQKRHLQTE